MMLAASSSRKRSTPLDFGTLCYQPAAAGPRSPLVAWIVLGIAREGDS